MGVDTGLIGEQEANKKTTGINKIMDCFMVYPVSSNSTIVEKQSWSSMCCSFYYLKRKSELGMEGIVIGWE